MKNKIIQVLMNEFRSGGFSGLSLSQISKATNLGKASLYHHFPGGKDQMALEVMRLAHAWIETEIVGPLVSNDRPEARLKVVLGKFNDFYECGEKACILEAMVATDAPASVKKQARLALILLVDGFKKLALDSRNNPEDALNTAEAAVVELQGALILSRGTQNRAVFKRALKRIERIFFPDEIEAT